MRRAWGGGIVALLAAVSAAAATVPLEYVAGISSLIATCRPQAVPLRASESEGEDLVGDLRLANGSYRLSIRSDGERAALAVDLDGDGALSPIAWDRVLGDGTFLASAEFLLPSADATGRVPYRMNLMWSPFLPRIVTFCRDSYQTGVLQGDGWSASIAVVEEDSDGRYDRGEVTLFVDVDGDGSLLTDADSHERFAGDEPFRIGAATFVVTAIASDGSSLDVEPAPEPVEPKAPLLVGFPAPNFGGESLDGRSTELAALRGHVVVLDFWASWCRSCLAELGGMDAVQKRFAERGVVVLAIDLDRTERAFREAVASSGVSTLQIYDGADGPIAGLYRIAGIPMTYLIGPDGIIRGKGLRGEALTAAIEALLEEET